VQCGLNIIMTTRHGGLPKKTVRFMKQKGQNQQETPNIRWRPYTTLVTQQVLRNKL
jgi:hypothetical protein